MFESYFCNHYQNLSINLIQYNEQISSSKIHPKPKYRFLVVSGCCGKTQTNLQKMTECFNGNINGVSIRDHVYYLVTGFSKNSSRLLKFPLLFVTTLREHRLSIQH